MPTCSCVRRRGHPVSPAGTGCVVLLTVEARAASIQAQYNEMSASSLGLARSGGRASETREFDFGEGTTSARYMGIHPSPGSPHRLADYGGMANPRADLAQFTPGLGSLRFNFGPRRRLSARFIPNVHSGSRPSGLVPRRQARHEAPL